jgi:addiction module HigA family antidote
LTIGEVAKALDVSRKTLSSILNRRSSITPEMALKLSIAFNTTAESWLMPQTQYDLWRAEQRKKKLRVERLAA